VDAARATVARSAFDDAVSRGVLGPCDCGAQANEYTDVIGCRAAQWRRPSYVAAQARVFGPVDLTHPPRAEKRKDLVGPEAGACGERHFVPPGGARRASSVGQFRTSSSDSLEVPSTFFMNRKRPSGATS